MIKADFRNAKKGDKVNCLYFGKGYIYCIVDENSPIGVVFDRHKEENDNRVCYYSFDGAYYSTANNTLFYDFPDQFPTEEHCKRPLPKIEVDEKVWHYRKDQKKWDRAHFSHFSRDQVYCYSYGRTEFTAGKNASNYYVGKYWKLESDPTINSGNLEEIEAENTEEIKKDFDK